MRFDVQKKILNFGLIDTVKKFTDSFEYSVPTKFNKDFTHATKLRLDYLYITPDLLSNLKYSKILRTKETNTLSDHFPIIAEFHRITFNCNSLTASKTLVSGERT